MIENFGVFTSEKQLKKIINKVKRSKLNYKGVMELNPFQRCMLNIHIDIPKMYCVVLEGESEQFDNFCKKNKNFMIRTS